MKRILFLVFAAILLHAPAVAKTIYCPTCSQSDFESAYYTQSSPGDTIVLPAGSATWGNSSRGNQGVIYIITNVTVIGQGDSTVITLDDTGKTYATGVIACWSAATFARFKIIGSAVNPVTAFHVSPYNNPTTGINFTGGFRITDVTFMGGTGGGYFAYVGSGVESGVIDNCRLTGEIGSAELIFGRGPTNAWQTDNTVGTLNNIFIEDCTFNNVGYVCDANSNARFVVRYNTITGSNKIDGHGLASNSPARGFRNMEIYGNRFTNTSPFSAAIEIRGGTSMIFDNVSDSPHGASGAWFFLSDYGYLGDWSNFGVTINSVSPGNPATITTSSPHNYATGWLVQVYCQAGATTPTIQGYYTVTVTGPNTFTIPVNVTAGGSGLSGCVTHRYQTLIDYPITDQVGVGRDPKAAHSEPAYLWNNLKKGAPWTRTVRAVDPGAINVYRSQTGNPSSLFTEDQIVQSNRDFYADAGFDANTGVRSGTLAQMNAFAPTMAGYGFWVTDQGSWNSNLPANTSGRLYTWNGSSWILKYTPCAYPHPLRAASMATLRVGSGKTYARPSLAAAAARDGDIVEIDAGTYTDDAAYWSASNLTLRGVGGRAHLHWAVGQISNGKAIWVIGGANTTVENIEFSGATVADQNGAGIRQEGAGLVLRNCYFHDNENGILTGSGDWNVLVENSEFANNGYGDGYTHNMYIGNIQKFTLQYSYSHHARIGHNVKSRARENRILYNRIMDEATGTASYAIDIPNGGTTYVVGNLIQQGPNTGNSGIVSYAAEGGSNPDQHLYVTNNTFVNDHDRGTFLAVGGTTPVFARNNLFIGPGTVYGGPGGVNVSTENLAAVSGLVNRGGYDYRLVPSSNAIDRGSDPGSVNGLSLMPAFQYVHSANREARPTNGALDFGAFEYTAPSSPPEGATWSSWLTLHFSPEEIAAPAIGGPGGDPDRDGLSNDLEYALGGDPKTPDSTLFQPESGFDLGRLMLTYRRLDAASDVTYIVEGSYDLAAWSATGITIITETPTPGGITLVTARDNISSSSQSRRFLRLRIAILGP